MNRSGIEHLLSNQVKLGGAENGSRPPQQQISARVAAADGPAHRFDSRFACKAPMLPALLAVPDVQQLQHRQHARRLTDCRPGSRAFCCVSLPSTQSLAGRRSPFACGPILAGECDTLACIPRRTVGCFPFASLGRLASSWAQRPSRLCWCETPSFCCSWGHCAIPPEPHYR